MTTNKNNIPWRSVQTARFVIYAMLPAFLLATFIYDIDPWGRRIYRYQLDSPVTTISKLFPAQRLEALSNGEQRVREFPIYFTARYPHRYDRVKVSVDIDNPQKLPWNIGIEVQGGALWAYFLEDPDANGTVEFDLDRAKVTARSLRFIVDARNFSTTSHFAVRSIGVELIRQ